MSNHLRILLDQTTSDQLTEAGGDAFLVVGRQSYPQDPSRWVLHLLPLPMKTACEASEVALGTRKAGKRIVTPAPPPEPAMGPQGGKDA